LSSGPGEHSGKARESGEKTQEEDAGQKSSEMSKKDLLKRAVKDYGSTVVVFHVAISLVSLGGFYTAVSRYNIAEGIWRSERLVAFLTFSGVDVVSLLEQLPLVGEKLASSDFGAGASTFVIAYAVHKVFAPVRISITLTATPFIVKFLRKRGLLKTKAWLQ